MYKRRKLKIITLVLVLLSLIGIVITVMLGEAELSFLTIIEIIVGQLFQRQELLEAYSQGIIAIVWEIRLPRVFTAFMVGTGLAVSGVVFQALLMNPLADPYTIGISTGAALGASVAIFFSAILQIYMMPILPAAFVGAIVTLVVVLAIAGKSNTLSAGNLIVAGIIVSSIGSAAISLLKSLSGEEVSIIVFWLMGSLASRSWQHVLIMVPVILIGVLICTAYGKELDILSLGEESAITLGVDVKKVRTMLLVTVSLVTAACVSVSGIIGFVGLVVPHILRRFITTDHRYLIPISGLVGGLLLLTADTITRVFLSVEIPVGVFTTLLGGPFFIYLFTHKDKSLID